jgi:hypothetical protein
MNKEQKELLDEAYENYKSTILEKEIKKSAFELTVQSMSGKTFILPQEEFINKCKTDTEFSEKWGLKIEERELSHDERFAIYKKVCDRDLQPHITGINFKQFHFDKYKIPTKLITISYNDKTIESYE